MGSMPGVHRAVDLQGSGVEGVPEELQNRLREVTKGDQVWVVSRGGLAFADMPMRSDLESALSNIVNFISGAALGVAVDTGTHLQLDIRCISPEGAQRVQDAVRGGLGIARLTTKDNELQLLQLYDAVNVDKHQNVVRVRADYSGELTDKLLSELRQLRGIGH